MIRYLLLLQFPLLYCVAIVMGLIVYGSDFDELAGQLYLIPLVLVPVLHAVLKRYPRVFLNTLVIVSVLMGGVLSALLAYKQMHFSFWDEHSVSQAAWLSVLGVFSYLSCVVAAASLLSDGRPHQSHAPGLSMALLVIGFTWLLSMAFPLVSVFVIASIMLAYLVFEWSYVRKNMTKVPVMIKGAGGSSLVFSSVIFILFVDLGLVVWDFQINSNWGLAFFVTFVCAALVAVNVISMPDDIKKKMSYPVIASVVINFIAAVIWPEWIVNMFHAALIGACLGWAVSGSLCSFERLMPQHAVSMSLSVFLGMIAGYLFYANLEFASYRLALLLPLIAVLTLYLRKHRWQLS